MSVEKRGKPAFRTHGKSRQQNHILTISIHYYDSELPLLRKRRGQRTTV